FVCEGGKALLGHIERRFEDDGTGIRDSADVELILGNIDADEYGEVIHTRTSFQLMRAGSLLNQSSMLTRAESPTNLSWLKAGNRLPKWLKSQGDISCPALNFFKLNYLYHIFM
ncbi:hypothetical protein SAMN04488510_1061, partial [Fervidobacterium changbaicum]